jgi:hypothetical protein
VEPITLQAEAPLVDNVSIVCIHSVMNAAPPRELELATDAGGVVITEDDISGSTTRLMTS